MKQSQMLGVSKRLPVKRPSLLYSVLPCRMITTMGPVPSSCALGFLLLAGVWVSSGDSSWGATEGTRRFDGAERGGVKLINCCVDKAMLLLQQ
jgi:hypothetical protein